LRKRQIVELLLFDNMPFDIRQIADRQLNVEQEFFVANFMAKEIVDHLPSVRCGRRSDFKKLIYFSDAIDCHSVASRSRRTLKTFRVQGCQTVYFRAKKSQYGNMLVGPWNGKGWFTYVTAIRNMLRSFD
jgi:hypothetical protein